MFDVIGKIMPWGPVFFGVLVFAPMWGAALDAAGVILLADTPNLVFTLVLGFAWGLLAKVRGRWL
jgi:hypothetical protein